MPDTTTSDSKEKLAGLVVESEQPKDTTDQLTLEVQRSLEETAQRAIQLVGDKNNEQKSWITAGQIVADFRPIPWFIWRISNFVLGRPGHINQVSEGYLLGLRRLLFAAASDNVLGAAKKINDVKKALGVLSSDVIAAVAVIHSVSRRLTSKPELQRIWRPILDDAILRAEIGYYVGEKRPPFGCGRGMLAGFAGRIGLAILIAQGDETQARKALERLAVGEEVGKVGLEIYDCHPLQISAMTLSACGCGRDAAFGTVSYATCGVKFVESDEQRYWLSAFSAAEALRIGKADDLSIEVWEALGFYEARQRAAITQISNDILRQGSSWAWLV